MLGPTFVRRLDIYLPLAELWASVRTNGTRGEADDDDHNNKKKQ